VSLQELVVGDADALESLYQQGDKPVSHSQTCANLTHHDQLSATCPASTGTPCGAISNRSTPPDRAGGPGSARTAQLSVGRPVSGADPDVAVLLDGVHPVPGLRRLLQNRVSVTSRCSRSADAAVVRHIGVRCQAAGTSRWILMMLNAVAASCNSLVTLSRPRSENRSTLLLRLPMHGSTVAPRRL
jgi:hypothetical protein